MCTDAQQLDLGFGGAYDHTAQYSTDWLKTSPTFCTVPPARQCAQDGHFCITIPLSAPGALLLVLRDKLMVAVNTALCPLSQALLCWSIRKGHRFTGTFPRSGIAF